MVLVQLKESSAGAWTVGTEVLAGNWAEEANVPRKVMRWGVSGSASVSSRFKLFYGNDLISEIWNKFAAAGDMVKGDDMQVVTSRRWLRPGETLRVVIEQAVSTTTPWHLVLDVKDAVRPCQYKGRTWR